jgi:aspartate/tyrosine/aromatic aminotransferase
MFEKIQPAPPDAILGLTEAFKNDPRPDKINLGVGVYKDGTGNTPIFAAVTEAQQRILSAESTKSYLPIDGSPAYSRAVQELLFGADHPLLGSGRAVTAHTPGGTGALRVAADFINQNQPDASIWVSDPTWANHPQIFAAAGLTVKTYPYFDASTNALAFDAFLAALKNIPAGDVVLLHGCCHNPTGVDPDPGQWQTIAQTLQEQRLLPLLDFAYQGLGSGLEEDAIGLRSLLDSGIEFLVSSSFSKNFGLYNERVGALTAVCATADTAQTVLSQLKINIRANYSNPPSHGAAIVECILADSQLRTDWQEELVQMCQRINQVRRLFVAELKAQGAHGDFSFIERQRGMFSFSGLDQGQVKTLKEKHAIYIVGSGRINIAGVTEENVVRLCKAVAEVTTA